MAVGDDSAELVACFDKNETPEGVHSKLKGKVTCFAIPPNRVRCENVDFGSP